MKWLLLTLLWGTAADAASLKAIIYASANNGPFVYTFEVDGALKYNVNGIGTAGAAFDSVAARVGNEGGSIQRVQMNVTNDSESMVGLIRPTQTNGPFAYTFEAAGVLKTVVNGVSSVGSAATALKNLIGAEGGTIVKGVITVSTQ